MLLALLSAGIAGALGLGRRGADPAAAAEDLARALRAARAAALAGNRDAAVTLDGTARRYRADGGGATTLPAGLTVTVDGAAGGAIRFHADGSSAGGSVLLSDGRNAVRVRTLWPTGLVRVEAGGPP